MSPEKVHTAFYAYPATRGGVCTLRRGARAARGCAGGLVCVARSSPGCAKARRVWCGGDKDRLTSQSHGVQSQRPTPSASTRRRTSCMWTSPTELALQAAPRDAASAELDRLVGSVQLCSGTLPHGSPARGTVSGDGRPPSVRVRCAGTGDNLVNSPTYRHARHVVFRNTDWAGRHTARLAHTRGLAIYRQQQQRMR